MGQVGIVLSLESSRLARNNRDWYQLLELCALTDTLIADADGVYHPGSYNVRHPPSTRSPTTPSPPRASTTCAAGPSRSAGPPTGST